MTKNTRTSLESIDKLRLLCQLGKDAVFALLQGKYGFTIMNDGTEYRYAYRQGSVPVLGVAHADTVLNSVNFEHDGKDKVYSPELDDRLGLWTLLHGLPSTGVNDYSILVTDFEEVGRSTASEFEPPIDFNWIFQFDRRGTGVVNYEYSDDGVFDSLLATSFGKLHNGSFSDICSLTHLGVKGFNVGTAYYNEHTQGCWGNLKELRKQMRNFQRFYSSFKGWKLPHRPRRSQSRQHTDWGSYAWDAKPKKTKKAKASGMPPAASVTRHRLNSIPAHDPIMNVECGSCLQEFNMNDCCEMATGEYICPDCFRYFESDFMAGDVVDGGMLDNPRDIDDETVPF